jgi:subfamily B ATP-binding cassette protein MsbA
MARRLWTFLAPFAPFLLGALAVMTVRAGLIAGVAFLAKPILDEHLLRQNVGIVRWAPLLVLGFYAAKSSLEYLQTYWMAIAGDGVCRNMREALYRHAVDLPVTFFHRHPVPTVLSRLIADVRYVQSVAATSLVTMLKDACSVGALGTLLVYRNWRLAGLALVVLPFAVYPLLRFGRFRRRRHHLEQEMLSEMMTVAHEGLAGNKIVKAFGTAEHEKRRFQERNDRLYALRGSVRRILAASNPVSEMVLAVAAAAIVGYGGYELLTERMTLGELVSFFVALGLLYEPVKRMGRNNLDLQAALAAVQRVGRILDEPTEPPRDDRPPLDVAEGRVEFRQVHFAYDERPVLEDVTFTAAPGETLALVGRSGAGKSTLMDLLAGFLEPTRGAILVDGQDTRAVSLASLRARIAIVPQDVFLFDDTIQANIAYGSPRADAAAVRRAAEVAEIHDVIERLPAGYDTRVGERGVRLSGGERQRVAIARAFLKDAPILILDEATSALDAATEARVVRSLDRLMAGRTVLIIAHRLSTIQRAGHVVVLAEGRIVEQGTHAILLARGGEYRRLYREQFARDAEADAGGEVAARS